MDDEVELEVSDTSNFLPEIVADEKKRIDNENIRINNERIRIQQEEERVAAESERQEKFESFDAKKADKTVTDYLMEQINNNSSRIDNLAKLDEGSTTGDAELIDVRVGEDDKTYNNAGEAVRNQFSNVNGFLMWLAENILIKKIKITGSSSQINSKNFIIDNNTHVDFNESENYKYRELEVSPGHKYNFSTYIGNNCYDYVFVDSDYNVILSGTKISNIANINKDVFVPKKATKILINCLSSRSCDIFEYISEKIPTDFESPYKYTLPDYYNEYLEEKINEINALEMDAGYNSATYTFITDIHISANKKKSFPLLERIKSRTNAEHCIYGGDSPVAIGSLDDLKKQNYEVEKYLYSIFLNNYHYIFR